MPLSGWLSLIIIITFAQLIVRIVLLLINTGVFLSTKLALALHLLLALCRIIRFIAGRLQQNLSLGKISV